MVTTCPRCKKQLQMSAAQQKKLQEALAALQPGKRLNIKCPNCQEKIALDNQGADAEEQVGVLGESSGYAPPAPPDLEWLKQEEIKGSAREENVPMALLLYPPGGQRQRVLETLESVGYQVVTNDTVDKAIERIRFVDFSAIVLHADFEGHGLEESTFHQFMRTMPMSGRRYIFYILIGRQFKTLYNLEALAMSSNLVVNEYDLDYLDVVLRHAIPAHEELFGPVMEELASYGKK